MQFHSICQGSRLCISANTEDVPWPTLLYAKFHLRGFQAESAILYLPVLVYGLPPDLYIRNLSQKMHSAFPTTNKEAECSLSVRSLSYKALKLLLLAK